jgi:hypothetical protein
MVGVKQSGKTFYLLSLYDRIRSKQIAGDQAFDLCDTKSLVGFDDQVRLVYEQFESPTPTAVERLPHPLVFRFHDRDRLGVEPCLVNLFDFGGEITDRNIDIDEVADRSARFDGFFYFLDPTKIHRTPGRGSAAGTPGDEGGTLQEQISALTKYRTKIARVRKVELNRPIDLPIAVCISKLDLLVTRNPMHEQARGWLRDLRATADRPPTLGLIRRRSRMVAQVFQVMFPNWNLEADLRKNFGTRYMFFPMSPVGIEEDELGEENLMNRTFAPFGLFEPLLWLLHMHGYCVFDGSTASRTPAAEPSRKPAGVDVG